MRAIKIVALSAGALGIGTAVGLVAWKFAGGFPDRPDSPNRDTAPDSPAGPNKTGWKKVDAILPALRAAAQSSGIPLGLMVGWICKESGGKLTDTTSLDERGYFQLMPSESKSLGLDHQRLSTDSGYSIDAGVQLIRKYQSDVNNLDLVSAPAGTSYYWRLVKLGHSMGSGQMKKVVKAAKDAGQSGSWSDLEAFATDMKINGPQPKKWFPFVDSVYKVGKPFGFGSEAPTVVGCLIGESGFDSLGATEFSQEAA